VCECEQELVLAFFWNFDKWSCLLGGFFDEPNPGLVFLLFKVIEIG
jgi:hypothetical protein